MEHFDAIIIGLGKGGKLLAADLANRGQQVAMIERSAAMYGGSCINIACIPTKALIHQAQMIKELNLASFEEKAAAYRKAIIKKNEVSGKADGYTPAPHSWNWTCYRKPWSSSEEDTSGWNSLLCLRLSEVR